MSPSALLTLAFLAACAGWTTGLATEGVPPLYLAVVATLAVLEMEAFRRVDAVRGRLMAVGELAGLVVIAVVPYLTASLFTSISSGAALVGVAAAFLVWLLASMSATDLEAVVEPTDLIEGLSGPAGRLTGRIWLVGLGLTVAVVLAHVSLAPVIEARPVRAAMVISYVAYWLVGLASMSAILRSRDLARWQRDEAQIDPDLRSRWRRGTHMWLAIAAGLVALLWWPAGRVLMAAHAATSAATLAISGWLTRILNPGRTPISNPVLPAVESTLPEAPQSPRLIEPPPAWWDLFVILAIGVFFALTYTMLSRRLRQPGTRQENRGRWLRAFIVLLGAIGDALVALVKALMRLRKRQPTYLVSHEAFATPRQQTIWVPPDRIRRRIAAEYRAFIAAATEEIGEPRPAETTAEYGRRVIEKLRDEPDVTDLSELYAEARFSAHELSEETADNARRWRKKIVSQLTNDELPDDHLAGPGGQAS